jgi:hypothetical protein
MSHKLTFTLKQHTPLIHFQPDQNGATLRATELKPKLDRFLIEKLDLLDDEKKPKETYKSWFVGDGEHPALDYKIKIQQKGETLYYLPLAMRINSNKERNLINFLAKQINFDFKLLYPTPFFANADKIKYKIKSDEIDEFKSKPDQIRFATLTFGDINITITSFHKELLKIIERDISEFFMETNFGMRQSKGFGSFTIIDDKYTNTIPKSVKYRFLIQDTETTRISLQSLFGKIHRFHQVLRSGINENGFYIKPFIFFYARSKGITWDKRYFKEKLLNHKTIEGQKQDHHASNNDPIAYWTDQNGYLVRDLLGLSTNQTWMKPKKCGHCDGYGFTLRHPREKNGRSVDKFNKKEIPLNKIKRFQSPIMYKPIKNESGYEVYIVLNEIPSSIFSTTFNILQEKRKEISKVLTDMRMWDGFDLDKFFYEEVYANKDRVTERMSGNSSDLRSEIENMFNSLEKVHP